ncbi:hypothetical protein HSX11_30065, partial [Oxalobacteraceae bacterium]|nr:hypothetical protein [Oxalobacteraceae bacterium]
MKKSAFFRKTRVTASVWVLASCALLTGCGNAADVGRDKSNGYVKSTGWKTVCVGRFLIDLPLSAELGATKVEYDGTYGFEGIDSAGSWGTLRWEGGKISETVPTDLIGFNKIRKRANGHLITPEMYKKLIQSRREEVVYRTKRAAKSPPRDVAFDLKALQEAKAELEDVIHNSKISKEILFEEGKGFAIRLGDEYILGFQDVKDQRVRTFSGALSVSENESENGIYEKYEKIRKNYHSRAPTDIPVAPGFCTNYGFIEETQIATVNVEMRVPIQIKEFPNLLLVLETEPAIQDSPINIQKFPNMDVAHIQLDKVGIKQKHGPKAEQILGTPGRSYAQEYGDNCSSTSCRPA